MDTTRMISLTGTAHLVGTGAPGMRRAVARRSMLIASIAFLTLIDLFGSQAILPMLTERYGVAPATMGVAVNASTLGMAVASLAVAAFAGGIDRPRAIWLSLLLLAVPTAALAFTDDLRVFIALRIVQGVFMAAAFTLTLTLLSERCAITAIAGAMAAYITGNVASNLFGRLLASTVADLHGVSASFLVFAALNVVGAAIACAYFASEDEQDRGRARGPLAVWRRQLSDPRLRAAFGCGFLLLFAFVATFSYANFALAAPPLGLGQMQIGLTYLVFAPAILTTPLAAEAVARFGPRRAAQIGIGAALIGLPMLLLPLFTAVFAGLVLVGAGLFFAQSVTTGHVGRIATKDRAAAHGLYLASYYLGGLCGAWLLGRVFGAAGWSATVWVLVAAVAGAGVLTLVMTREADRP